MACIDRSLLLASLLMLLASIAHGQLNPNFYSRTCPNLQTIVRNDMAKAIQKDPRMGASILRLFFHDCFVNGCDASVLLDDTPQTEKNAPPNINSLRGFDVIDTIKSNVEKSCKKTVSCADILALAARDSVNLLGGPNWPVKLGRRDAKQPGASVGDLPPPSAGLSELISKFRAKGLSAQDMTALSGAHTLGQARCGTFRSRINFDRNIDGSFKALLQRTCPVGGDSRLAPLDVQTPNNFDNRFYQNLVIKKGLLHSDQELYNGGSQDSLVKKHSVNPSAFANDFVTAMGKMGDISPLTGLAGEIRLNCHRKN